MNSLLDLAFSLLTSPRKAMGLVTGGEKFLEAMWLWLFVVLLCGISAFEEGPGIVVQTLCMAFFMGIGILLHSAMTDYISGLLGGRGTAKGITAGFLAASLPMAFGVFFTFLEAIGLSALTGLGGLVIWGWTFYLDMLAIRENYGFPSGKSCLINLAPYLLALLMVILSMAIVILLAAAGISALEEAQGLEAVLNAL